MKWLWQLLRRILNWGTCCEVIFIIIFILLVIPFILKYNNVSFYAVGVVYHGEVLAVGYCRATSPLGMDVIMHFVDNELRSALTHGSCNGSYNLIEMVNQGINKSFHGKCLFNSVDYAPALEDANITYEGAERHGATIYIYLRRNGSNGASKDFITIRTSRNNLNINIIVLALPLIMSIKKFANSVAKDNEETRIEHYYLLIGISYLSLSLFIHFIAWAGAAFQNTALVELMCIVVAVLLLLLGTWSVVTNFNIILIIIMIVLLRMIFLLKLIPTKLNGISSNIAIGVSIVYTVLLTLLNISNIKAISAAYGISLTMASVILSFELLYVFVYYDIVSSPSELLALLALLACYILCVFGPADVRTRRGSEDD